MYDPQSLDPKSNAFTYETVLSVFFGCTCTLKLKLQVSLGELKSLFSVEYTIIFSCFCIRQGLCASCYVLDFCSFWKWLTFTPVLGRILKNINDVMPCGTRWHYVLNIWSICVKFAQPKDLGKICTVKE